EIRARAGLGHRDRRDQLPRGDARQPALALGLAAVAEEVGQADVVLQRDAEAERADAGPLGLLADDQVEAEVLRARAAVALGDGHAEKAARARPREHLARHDSRALPVPVAALLADHLALEKGAETSAKVLVLVLEQPPPHVLGPYSRQECKAPTSNTTADEARRRSHNRSTAGRG